MRGYYTYPNALVKVPVREETQHLDSHGAAIVVSSEHGGAIAFIFLDKVPVWTDVDVHSFWYTPQTTTRLAQGVQQLAPIVIMNSVF